MRKYLEQTEWLLNPIEPDRRKSGRWLKQFFPVGTRWMYDEKRGTLYGEGMSLDGEHAERVRASGKEVEPGYGELISEQRALRLIGQLIDQGTITNAEVLALVGHYESGDDEEEDEAWAKDEERKWLARTELQRQRFEYRHWLSLDPPDETLERRVADDERQDAILREFEQRTNPEAKTL
jgi:hypothetical protein